MVGLTLVTIVHEIVLTVDLFFNVCDGGAEMEITEEVLEEVAEESDEDMNLILLDWV